MLGSAKHQHESAIGTHISPPTWTSLPAPSPSTPLGCSRALVWVPWNIQQIPTGYLRNKHWSFHIILQDSNSITVEMGIAPFFKKKKQTQKEKLPTLGVLKLQSIRVTGRLTETQIAGPLTPEVSDSVGLGCELDHKEGWALKNWCLWIEVLRRLLRVLGTARRSNQSNLKEINPEYSLEGLMLKLKLQSFSYLMQRSDSAKNPDGGKHWGQEEERATENEMVGWHHLTQWTWVWANFQKW